MKIGNPQYRGSEVPLPVEVLDSICHFIKAAHEATSQSTLAAGALVSRSWYLVFTRHLYEKPIITPATFDGFTRTICTTVTAKSKRIGLEKFVKHLDLRKIAYESSKSLTSRLIGRTSQSLEYFAAPAITFGIGSLAPLSKSSNLRVLDLSHDGYQINMNRILDSLSRLEYLTELRLPTDAAGDGAKCHFPPDCWPRRLTLLQMSLKKCMYMDWWDEFFDSLPETLQTFIIPECYSYVPFFIFKDLQRSAKSITAFEIGRSSNDGEIVSLHHILSRFPATTALTVPATMKIALEDHTLGPWADEESWESLYIPSTTKLVQKDSLVEELTFSRPPTSVAFGFRGSINLKVFFLKAIVASFPSLQRLNIPKESIELTDKDEDDEEISKLCEVLESRASSDKLQYAGIFMDEGGHN